MNSSAILLMGYLGIRELAVVDRLHREAPHINLYDRRPLFAFSRLTSTIAGLVIALSYAFYLAFPTVTSNPVAFGFILAVNLPLSLAAFALPLYGMHRRIADEKDRLLADASLRLQATTHTIHERMEAGRLKGVEHLNVVMSALLNEERYLRTIPTWPWDPGTLTGLLTAVFLSLILFAAQRLIETLLLN